MPWVFLFFIYIYKGVGDYSGNEIPEEWQLVCNQRELNCVFVFLFFIYIYKRVGDSSGNEIPEEWQLVCN